MDLNEINKSIYNKRNGSNNQSLKDQDDKELKEYDGFQNNKTYIYDEKKGNSQENDFSDKISRASKIENKNYSMDLIKSDFNKKIVEKNFEEKESEDISNYLNENENENKIKRIKTHVINNSNKNAIFSLENDDDKILNANPINNAKNNDLIQSNLKPETINKIFSNKQNSLDLNQKNYALLNETVQPKLNKKPIPQKLNDVINEQKISQKKEENDEPFFDKVHPMIHSERNRRLPSHGIIGENKISKNIPQNNNSRISKVNSLFNDEFNNNNKTKRYNNILDNKTDNSLYIIDSKNISDNKDVILGKNKKFEDINMIDYKNAIKEEDDLHSFNPKNSLNNNINRNRDDIINNITPNLNNLKPFINRSVSITNNDNTSNLKLNNQISSEQIIFDNRVNNNDNRNQNIGLNPANNQIYTDIPCVLGSGYKFNYDKYVNSSQKNQKQQDFRKNSQNKAKVQVKDDIEEMLNNLKGGIIKKTENSNLDKNILINKKSNLDANSNITDYNKINKEEKTIIPQSQEEKIDTELIKKNSEIIKSPEKVRLFANLKTNLLHNFKLENYKNLPNFQLPLEYNTPEKKSKIKKYFIDLAKSSLYDIKRDDLKSTIKNLELLLFYFTNMKDK